MKHQIEKLLFKNRIRLLKGTIIHTWPTLIGVIVAVAVLGYQFFSFAMPEGSLYVLILVSGISLFRIFVLNTPVFRIEAASMLHMYNTKYFRKQIRYRAFGSVWKSILFSGIIALGMSGFLLDKSFFDLWFLLTLYNCNSSFLSWVFYHEKSKTVFFVYLICTLLLLLQSFISVICLILCLVCLWFYSEKFLKLDIPRYKERIQSLEAASVAVSHNDYSKMVQMADENRPQTVKWPTLELFNPGKKTALVIKSFLELLRVQKQTVVLLVLLILLGWILSRTEILSFLPLLADEAINRLIAAFCTVMALSALYQILIKQAKTVSDKRKLGLSLPYSTMSVVLAYGFTATVINLIVALTISLLYTCFSARIIVLLFAQTSAFSVPCILQLREKKIQKGATTVMNIVLLVAVYYYLRGYDI